MASLTTALYNAGWRGNMYPEIIAALGDDADFAGTVTAALAGKQPLDSDLTAIAALTTTAYGRAFLALADAAAARTTLGLGTAATANSTAFETAGAAAAAQTAATNAAATDATTKANAAQAAAIAASQPVDSDLTAIAALTTTAFGRSFLALVDAAAARTLLGLGTAATTASTAYDVAGAATAAQSAAIAAAATDATTKANAAQAASQPVHLPSYLTAAVTRTLTAYASTGLSVSVAAGKVYKITAGGQYRSAALTTGIGFRLGGTATATGVHYKTVIEGLTATTNTIQAQAALGVTAATSTAVAVINNDYPWAIDGLVRVNAAGTITVDFASKVASSTVTVQSESYLLLEQVG